MQRWNGWASAAESSHLQPLLDRGSTKTSRAKMAPSLLSLPAACTYPCVFVGDFSSFQQWWTFCHSSSPCRWMASRRCACACEPGAFAARRSSSRSPRRRTWTSGRSLETREPNKEKLLSEVMYRDFKQDIHRCQSSVQFRPTSFVGVKGCPTGASGYLCVLRWYLRWAGQVNVLQQPSNEQRRICLGSGRPLWGARSPSPVGLCVWSPRQPEKEKWDRLCRKQLHECQRATLRSLGR